MERIFLLKGLDCPNCSAKIEKEVGDLENVNSSSVNLMKQTLTIQTETFDNSIVEQIETIVHSHEPDVCNNEYKKQQWSSSPIAVFFLYIITAFFFPFLSRT